MSENALHPKRHNSNDQGIHLFVAIKTVCFASCERIQKYSLHKAPMMTLHIRTGSALLLVLVLLFIFIGMAAFQEGDPDAGQVAKNLC